MNFALLGIDDDVLAFARAIVANDEHRIVSTFEPGEHAAALHALAPWAATDLEWESLLLENVVDGVIVGRGGSAGDARGEQLRKLAQAKIPLVVIHPGVEAIVGYEIEMIRRDVGGVIVPYYPGVGSEIMREMAGMVETKEGDIGPVEQLVFERQLIDRQKPQVLAQLSRDVALVRDIVGSIKSVSAAGTLAGEGPVTLSVQMTSEDGCLVRWSLEPAPAASGATLTLLGTRGKAVCRMPAIGDWELVRPSHQTARREAREQEATRVLEDFSHALALSRTPSTSWVDACRATEVADTVPRCLARGKTIELYNEQHTEEGAFKGVMAVGGCLIMLLGLLMVVFVAIVEGLQLPLHRFALWSNWPLYICAAFFFFLLLQLLRFVARGR